MRLHFPKLILYLRQMKRHALLLNARCHGYKHASAWCIGGRSRPKHKFSIHCRWQPRSILCKGWTNRRALAYVMAPRCLCARRAAPPHVVRRCRLLCAEGSASQFQAQRTLGHRARLTLVASQSRLYGTATRADLTGIALRGADARLTIELDVRVQLSRAWKAAVLGGITSQSSDRTDYVAQSGLYTKGTVPLVGAETARNAGPAQVTMGARLRARRHLAPFRPPARLDRTTGASAVPMSRMRWRRHMPSLAGSP